MRWQRRHLFLLLMAIVSFLGLVILVISFPPDEGAPIPNVPLFFVLLFLFTSTGASFILKNIWFGIVIGILITSFFLLRLFF